jgi:hypothetical protein
MGNSNNVVFNSQLAGGEGIRWARLHYKFGNGQWNVKEMNISASTASDTLLPSEVAGAKTFYYYIEASDDFYDPAFWKTLISPQETDFVVEMQFVNVQSGQVSVPDTNTQDGNTGVQIPTGALDAPINIVVKEVDVQTLPIFKTGAFGTQPVAAYDFGPEGTSFNKPVEVTLLYLDTNNDGEVELPDGTPSGIQEADLKAYWWDGFSWVMMGGQVDPVANTVTFKTTHFSTYALFKSAGVAASDIRPSERVFTPLVSGQNNTVTFNGISDQAYTLNIYDVSGRKARTISYPDMAVWDGKDENGQVVESGVYIYQIETQINGSRKLVSGTVTVAK